MWLLFLPKDSPPYLNIFTYNDYCLLWLFYSILSKIVLWIKVSFFLVLVFAGKKNEWWMLFIHSFFSNKLGKNETFWMFCLLSTGLRDAGFEFWPGVDPSSSRPSHFSWIFSVSGRPEASCGPMTLLGPIGFLLCTAWWFDSLVTAGG